MRRTGAACVTRVAAPGHPVLIKESAPAEPLISAGEGGGRDRSAHPAYGRAASELVADDVAAHAALGSSLARVLRLPLSDRDGED